MTDSHDKPPPPARRRSAASLRSARWFAPDDLRAFGHRSRLMQMGYAPEDWAGRPVIGILNTWSDINPCHAHFKQRVEDVKRGVLQAGGFPLELPAIRSPRPSSSRPPCSIATCWRWRPRRCCGRHPLDGAVLMGGCDKSTPALLMGAISAGLPAIYLPAGPMLRGNWQGKVLGSGSDAWKYWDERRAGKLTKTRMDRRRGRHRPQPGTCMTMGTASTMTAIAEAIGLTLPGASSIPAVDIGHARMWAECGRRIVEMVWDDLTPAKILTPRLVRERDRRRHGDGLLDQRHHPSRGDGAARRAFDIGLDDFDRASRVVPVIANIRPSGDTYLMEDFFYAGGLPALMSRLEGHLQPDALTVTGRSLGENIAGAKVFDDDVIRSVATAIYAEGALAVLRGNLAPSGCVIKPSACAPELLRHTGPRDRLRRLSGDEGRGRRRGASTSPPRTCWCCATPARRAAPACPSGACCRSRRSC